MKRTLLIAFLIALCLTPLIWTLLASFDLMPVDLYSSFTWDLKPSLEGYREIGVEEPMFLLELLTSAGLSAFTTVLTLIVALLAAYGIARSRLRRRRLLVQSLMVLASLPVISYLIPLRNVLVSLRLYDTFAGTMCAETAMYAPLAAYVLFGYLSSLPSEPEECARIEGASTLQIFCRITLPSLVYPVAATAIIVFVLSWNHVLMPLILKTPVKTVPVAMIDFFVVERELEWPTAAAALIVSLMPIVVFVAVAHRWLELFSLIGAEESE